MALKRKKKELTVDGYIAMQPEEKRPSLQQIRRIIKDAVPGATEVISYQMPGYKFHGMLAWFAAHKDHYGFYPMASAIEVFRVKLKDYEVSKGTVRFPAGEPLPGELIREIISFRAKENLQKAASKKSARKKTAG